MAQFRPILNENGVTEQQWRIVRALLMHGPLEPRQLCTLCQISSPSIVGVLQRMGKLVREVPDFWSAGNAAESPKPKEAPEARSAAGSA